MSQTDQTDILIKQYASNPIQNFTMKDPTVEQHEGNFICWDDITVYLKIQDNKIIDYSFDWNCSTITTAASSFLAEFIIWADIQDVLWRDYNFISSNWFEVSPRRKRAAVIALLAARNAIHKYLQDSKTDEFMDIIADL